MNLLRDPRLLNFVLVGLYAFNSARWAIARNGPQTLYWVGAAIITSAVTWGVSK